MGGNQSRGDGGFGGRTAAKAVVDAVRAGDADALERLLDRNSASNGNSNSINSCSLDWIGNTAVHLAVQLGHVNLVPILDRAGYLLDAPDHLGRTAFGF